MQNRYSIKRSWRVSFYCVFAYFHNELRPPSCRKCSFPNLEFAKFPQHTHFLPHRLSYLFFPPTTPSKSSSPIYLPNASTLGQHFLIFHFLPLRFLAHETSGSMQCDLWCVMNWSYRPKTTQR